VTLLPRVKTSTVRGKITDERGNPVAATVRLVGPQNAEVKTDESGAFSSGLPAGSYVVRVQADRFLNKEMKIDVAEGQEKEASLSLRSRPAESQVVFQGGRLTLRQPVSFRGKGEALDLTPTSAAVLQELADTLASHPEIKRLRIEAHWDSSLPNNKAQQLTDKQANLVASSLVKDGVAPDRLEAAGLGARKPLRLNLGVLKRGNRRVEFHVVD